MSLERIRGILFQEYYMTKRSIEIIVDIFYFPIVTVVVFGTVSVYLMGQIKSASAHYLILGIILWEVIRITQYSVTMGTLWNLWNRNLSNLFITPLTFKEFLTAQILSGLIKTLIVFIISALLCLYMFQFDIFKIGVLNLSLHILNLMIFSWSSGLFVVGLLFKMGTKIQAFSWSLIYLIQPITGAFYPVSILPSFLQKIAYLFPTTHVFEAARINLTNTHTNWYLVGMALFLNMVYLAFSIWFFNIMLRASQRSGQFARNEA